jgi:hypothetical protein
MRKDSCIAGTEIELTYIELSYIVGSASTAFPGSQRPGGTIIKEIPGHAAAVAVDGALFLSESTL